MTYRQITQTLGTTIGTLCQAMAFVFVMAFLIPVAPLIWAMGELEKRKKN